MAHRMHAAIHTVVCGIGGRVIVLHGTTGRILAQSEDLGFAAMALASSLPVDHRTELPVDH